MKLTLLLVTVLVLFAAPAIADDPPGTETADAAVSCTLGPPDPRAETALSEAAQPDLETPVEIDLLGLQSPLDLTSYGLGYCYHDCSRCETREDCKEPGFPFGFPCTEIPLC